MPTGVTDWEWPDNEGPNSFPGSLPLQGGTNWEPRYDFSFYALTASVAESEIKAGDTVTVDFEAFNIDDPAPYATFDVVVLVDGTEENRAAVTTGADGTASAQVTVPVPGDATITVEDDTKAPKIRTERTDWEWPDDQGPNSFPTNFETTGTTNWEP